MSEDKTEKLTEIVKSLSEIAEEQYIPSPFENKAAEIEATMLILELRQIIERLRRIVDEGESPIEVHSLQDAMKLNRDELAYLAWQFFQWINSDEGCPADKCKDFPCKYRREQKATCEENLKNGDLDEFGMKEQQDNGFFADFCGGDRQGCWAEYYLWCYRNGVDPLNGKKEKK